MIEFKLPNSTKVDKFLPKNTFIQKVSNGKVLFSDIEKITWSYKLSPKTIKIDGTDSVEEIHIFDMSLKSKEIPTKVIAQMRKLIPYPILFRLRYNDDFCYTIALLDIKKQYSSDWNEEIEFNFVDTNLEKVYQNIVQKFLKNIDAAKSADFKQTIELDNKIEALQKQIEIVKNKRDREKQFDRKTEINKELKKLKKDLDVLKGSNI